MSKEIRITGLDVARTIYFERHAKFPFINLPAVFKSPLCCASSLCFSIIGGSVPCCSTPVRLVELTNDFFHADCAFGQVSFLVRG